MPSRICYLGDDHLQGAAAYLAGILKHHGLAFDYVPSAEAPPAGFDSRPYAVYVISDYPAPRLGHAALTQMAARVEQGAGLVMIGGWESFHGLQGGYDESPLAAVLPVTMQSCDDRRNFAQPCLIEKVADHEILAGLPWDRPPGIGGVNVVTAKPEAETLLAAAEFSVVHAKPIKSFRLAGKDTAAASFSVVSSGEAYKFIPTAAHPLLVVGRHGTGRTAALATDVAPHWVGGFVDWGDQRIVQDVGGGMIEVGNWYARFFRNLVAWAGKTAEFCEDSHQ
jgi:uncharacterized membrane protein